VTRSDPIAEIQPFWRRKRLSQLTKAEWESLCDGCAKCCLLKLEDADTGEIAYTDVACRLLDLNTCRCRNYAERNRIVPDCIVLSAKMVRSLSWLPETCAYRLVSEGKDLPLWHPLVSGDLESVHRSSVSVRGRAISEDDAGDLEERIVDWSR